MDEGGLCRGYSECGVFVSCWNHPAGLAWPGLAKCFKCGHMSELGTISRVWAGSGQADNGRCSWSINTAPARVCSIHCSSGIHHAAGADTLIGHCCRGGERLLHSVEVVPSCCWRDVMVTRALLAVMNATSLSRHNVAKDGHLHVRAGPSPVLPLLIIREMPTPGSPGYFANRFLVTPGRGGARPGQLLTLDTRR